MTYREWLQAPSLTFFRGALYSPAHLGTVTDTDSTVCEGWHPAKFEPEFSSVPWGKWRAGEYWSKENTILG